MACLGFTEFFHQIQSKTNHSGWHFWDYTVKIPSNPIEKAPLRLAFLDYTVKIQSNPIEKGPSRLPFLDFTRKNVHEILSKEGHSGCHFWIFTVKNFIKSDRQRTISCGIFGFQRIFSSNPIENQPFRLAFLGL